MAPDGRLSDAHCHIDFSCDPIGFARRAAANGIVQLSSTVTPEGYDRACMMLDCEDFPLVRVGVGLHPWWVAAEEASVDEQIRAMCARIPAAAFVGEVGLDFSPRHAATAEQQVRSFQAVVQAAVAAGGKVLSIHAVRAAGTVLDILERAEALETCQCVLHWFSGTSDELTRARRLGCWFSVGPRLLATKRGRAYVRQMPIDRLLLETDLPAQPGDTLAFERYREALEMAYAQVGALRGDEAADATAANARALLAHCG